MASLSLMTPAQAETVSTFTLENGLQVVLIEDHRAPVVVQMIWYRAGAADEPAGKSGIAHFLEHLMFKGTDTIPPNAFSAMIEAQGGDDNAFTSWDYTAYFQRIAADRLELVMEMEADRMRNLRMTEEDVTTERQVVLEERSQRTDSDPGALMAEQMRAAQFMNHRYGVPIIGWRHEMEELSRADALAWYTKFYAPNNAILIIAGDADPAQVKEWAEKYYGPILPSPEIGPRLRPQEPPQLAERRLSYADERVSDPYIYRSYLAPERDPGAQKEAAALTILAELLGGDGQTSHLARALQFDSQTAVYSAAYYNGTAIDDTTFGLILVPAPGVSLDEAEAALDAAVADFIAQGPDPAAFARIQTQIRASEIYARDNIRGLAQRYGEGLTIGLSLEDVQAWDDVLASVTIEEVQAVAAQVLDRKNAVTARLLRAEEPPKPETEPSSESPDEAAAEAPAQIPTEETQQ
ncbi:pitrilysin family protein [Xinfangfangia sp. CPCC 101601]|uniref:Pitrilysin family protein n=1 Tax=Pseudogemmobacter lacusdianii TaxID=3069608 RepID=A0ABU0VXL6_9RHOB|nr:pitrilysin family protein [Xinfangfangia sp. CPCC 101601]MDQ2066253.1 pitrilysin family protein [Xinfangfangia sp. CPCC 101601]